ncbi:MAG: universal stress protein [Solirubrobacteraceae bacterium]|nr:universal stress protein [Solirubrobacteraceae bacterium]
MYENVVIGVDNDSDGRDSLVLADALAAAGARISLTHIWSRLEGVVSAATDAPWPAQEAEALLKGVAAHLPRAGRTIGREAGTVRDGLHALCAELGADLLVVGTGHRTAGIVHGSPCDVAVASPGLAGGGWELKRVTVGSEHPVDDASVIAAARELATSQGGGLDVVSVLAPPSAWTPGPVAAAEVLAEISGDAEAERRAELVAAGAQDARVAEGNPVLLLSQESAGHDLLVLGADTRRGRSPGLAASRTIDALLGRARGPVLVTARDRHDHDEGTPRPEG